MRVLWFSNTSSLYKPDNSPYYGGGWIKSLEQLVIDQSGIELAISFFHSTDSEIQKKINVSYYPILRKKKTAFKKLINNWSCRIESKSYVQHFMSIINDFKPDLIHIFGTEGPFALIQSLTNIPVVIHLQGLISPYLNAFYPPEVNNYNVLFEPLFFKKHLLGNSLYFDKKRFEKQAKREQIYFKNAKNLMGRTIWDKSISNLLAPQSAYFHVDEVLRPIFYNSEEWFPKQRKKLIIVSTISNTIYKGFDLILKTAKLFKENTSISFEWQIAGLSQTDSIVPFFEHQLNLKCKDYNVNIIGPKDSNELIKILKEADVFVHPSYIDNSPNSLCEAQLLGIPVIACNVGGVASLIKNKVSGILIPANDPYELTIQIKALAFDKTFASGIGKQGRKKALLRHNRDKILADIMNCYKSIINQ